MLRCGRRWKARPAGDAQICRTLHGRRRGFQRLAARCADLRPAGAAGPGGGRDRAALGLAETSRNHQAIAGAAVSGTRIATFAGDLYVHCRDRGAGLRDAVRRLAEGCAAGDGLTRPSSGCSSPATPSVTRNTSARASMPGEAAGLAAPGSPSRHACRRSGWPGARQGLHLRGHRGRVGSPDRRLVSGTRISAQELRRDAAVAARGRPHGGGACRQ